MHQPARLPPRPPPPQPSASPAKSQEPDRSPAGSPGRGRGVRSAVRWPADQLPDPAQGPPRHAEGANAPSSDFTLATVAAAMTAVLGMR